MNSAVCCCMYAITKHIKECIINDFRKKNADKPELEMVDQETSKRLAATRKQNSEETI